MDEPSPLSREHIEFGRSVLRREGQAILALADRLGQGFADACERVRSAPGAVLVSGVGKAGIVGRKISATMASTGTRSYWLDPVNAMHGDLGMVTSEDIALLLSNSGTSGEILAVAQVLRGLGVERIAFTRDVGTDLAKACDVVVEIGPVEEACPLRLAPSTSTTAMLALGDALALAVQRAKGFTEREYARLHPAGALGRRLLRVRDCMRTGERVALATPDTPLVEAVSRITRSRCGACVVVSQDGTLAGIYTDGDFRRDWAKGRELAKATLAERMTRDCKRIRDDRLVAEALELMHEKRINALPVVDGGQLVLGLLDIQDVV